MQCHIMSHCSWFQLESTPDMFRTIKPLWTFRGLRTTRFKLLYRQLKGRIKIWGTSYLAESFQVKSTFLTSMFKFCHYLLSVSKYVLSTPTLVLYIVELNFHSWGISCILMLNLQSISPGTAKKRCNDGYPSFSFVKNRIISLVL